MEPVQAKGISLEEINEMEERRIARLDEAGINEMDVLAQARDNLNIWQNYFNENMTRGKDDLNFALRDQWTAIERSEFNRLFKVAFTANKLLDPINKIRGEQRKNKPDLIVRSLTGKATQEQINLRADLVRTISYQSQNDLIYQTAFNQALLMGWGAFQIDLDYENPRSFNKIIKFLLIPDAVRTTFDPMAIKPHKGDGDYCARQYVFGRDQFAATYPYVLNPVSYSDPRMFLDFQWETRDTIVICDYYVKEWYSLKILKLSNGDSVTESQWEDMQKNEIKLQKELAASAHASESRDLILSLIPKVVAERQTQDYDIMHYRLIKDRIIEFSKWPSRYLPIIFVDGNSHFIEGRQYTRSYIHEAKDTQRFLNYLLSERATEIKNRRREQWLGTPDNIVGYEQDWRNPELQVGMLKAKVDPKTGQLPQKMTAWQLSQELIQEYQTCGQDIREILGYSEQQELQGRDISGKARRERKLEGSMAAYVYYDNLNQAIEQAGRTVLDLLPHVYGEDERHLIITKKDGKSNSIVLNKRNSDGSIENAIEVGDYDIEINTGPSFAVQKDMALEFFQQTLQASPQLFPLIADLWAKNLDIQYQEQIVERFKTIVPPQILAKEEGKELPPQPPSPQEQAMQMEMKMKQAELQEKQAELQLRADQHQLDRERHQLEKLQMIMEAKKMASDMHMDVKNRESEMHKADLDYSAKIAKVLADLHK
jgi:hypothetical protein